MLCNGLPVDRPSLLPVIQPASHVFSVVVDDIGTGVGWGGGEEEREGVMERKTSRESTKMSPSSQLIVIGKTSRKMFVRM